MIRIVLEFRGGPSDVKRRFEDVDDLISDLCPQAMTGEYIDDATRITTGKR